MKITFVQKPETRMSLMDWHKKGMMRPGMIFAADESTGCIVVIILSEKDSQGAPMCVVIQDREDSLRWHYTFSIATFSSLFRRAEADLHLTMD